MTTALILEGETLFAAPPKLPCSRAFLGACAVGIRESENSISPCPWLID